MQIDYSVTNYHDHHLSDCINVLKAFRRVVTIILRDLIGLTVNQH